VDGKSPAVDFRRTKISHLKRIFSHKYGARAL
jgi:hypothetical protein